MSQLFGATLRTAPAGTEAASHQLLVRAGFIRQLGQGLFSYLPLARRSLTRIETVLREEMTAIGGQELTMPVVHPAEIWRVTGRYQSVGPELVRFRDRRDRPMVLAMTHEEVVAALCATEIGSYRQLPQLVYQIQTKFRDDPRPRAGLIRVREFTMKDSYSLDADQAGLDRQYRAHLVAYERIFARCALPTVTVGSDVGMMGGSLAHEFMYLTPVGEDTIVRCPGCGYAANRQIARFAKPGAPPEPPLPLERVATPGVHTIQALAERLEVPASRTAKAVFLVAELAARPDRPELVFAVVRGDMEVNETKLANTIGAVALRPATEEEIRAVGAVPGSASPVGLPGVPTVVDDAVVGSPNLVAGANEEGYHLRNTNAGRDYQPTTVADIAAAAAGDPCLRCGQPLSTSRGVEVGNTFQLGDRYSRAAGATYLAEDGTAHPVLMGSYGIGVGRLLACVAEEHRDERGLRWPVSVAPYEAHLTALGGPASPAQAVAERCYAGLRAAGVEVLLDDRDERPGVQFADADLIGAPLRVTVGERSLERGGAELKRRDAGPEQVRLVRPDAVPAEVAAELAAQRAELETAAARRAAAIAPGW